MHGCTCCPPFEKSMGQAGFCPCCVRALAIILQRIIDLDIPNKNIDLLTTAQVQAGQFENVTPIRIINGTLLEVEKNNHQSLISLCDLVTVTRAEPDSTAVETVSLEGINLEGCGCCEQALTSLFAQLPPSSSFDILTTNPQADNEVHVSQILAVTTGVVKVLSNQGEKLVSLCHVVALQNIVPPLTHSSSQGSSSSCNI